MPGRFQPGPSRTRGFVKVQDGCDCHCAYCIIPTVRGSARSRPAGAVLDEVRRRAQAGQPEMVMTGISVGDYRDPQCGLDLGELMLEVAQVPGVDRVRLSSVEVIHVRDSLLAALAGEPKICPHLHIPLQSGDDGVLRDMGRHYSRAEYLELVAALRRAIPQVNLTTDVADYTRCYLPAGAGERGELVDVWCNELHADGIACRIPGPAPLPSAV
jgi:threonylcarbamoyladenosine tRNA methylthiotransferase MtaB